MSFRCPGIRVLPCLQCGMKEGSSLEFDATHVLSFLSIKRRNAGIMFSMHARLINVMKINAVT